MNETIWANTHTYIAITVIIALLVIYLMYKRQSGLYEKFMYMKILLL